jgi:hypothetical protein
LAEQAVVLDNTPLIDRRPNQAPVEVRPANAGQGAGGSPKSGHLVPGGMEAKRRYLQDKGLSAKTADTILAAKSTATFKKYDACWQHFAGWCRTHDIDPFQSSVPDVLEYLQSCLDKDGLSVETVRGRVYPIALYHKRLPLDQLSQHPWVTAFISGMKKTHYRPRKMHPKWVLQWVLQALRGRPFEPMSSHRLDYLTYKTAFLLAITSAKRVGELQALSVSDRYYSNTPAGLRLSLNPHFIPKVCSDKNREQEIFFTPFCPRTDPASTNTLHTLCVKRAVGKYVKATKPFRKSDALFVCFSGPNKGCKAAKASISRWVRKGIELAYKALKKKLPKGIRAHSTRAVSTTWAQYNNSSLRDICDTASWGHSSTFTKFYQLNLAGGESSARFANAVLQTVLDGRPQ